VQRSRLLVQFSAMLCVPPRPLRRAVQEPDRL